MENIFVEFLPPWVETGLQPAFYDKESGTVLQQTARMYARVNMLIRMFNKLSKQTKETVEEYIEKFNELYNYVHDYFDNLDVQEEINNKLDDMTEAGTLQEIITAYIQANVAWCFDTVADMKLAENLVNGSYAQTLGFHSINDGGGAIYKISNTGSANEMDVIAVGDLYAILQATEANVLQFGAYGDNTHSDDDYITRAYDYAIANSLVLRIPKKVYKIDGNLSLKHAIIRCDGTLHNTNPLVIGAYSTGSTTTDVYIYSSGDIQIEGAKDSYFNLVHVGHITMYSDGNDATNTSQAYNKIDGIRCKSFTINGVNGGWINDNEINIRRCNDSITITSDGSYPHNNNRFTNICLEGASKTITIDYGHDNYIYYRGENNPIVTMGADCFGNIVKRQYESLYYRIYDLDFINKNKSLNFTGRDGLPNSKQTQILSLNLDNVNHYNAGLAINNAGEITGSWKPIYLNSNINPELPFTIITNSNTNSHRVFITLFDENNQKMQGNIGSTGISWDGTNGYYTTSNDRANTSITYKPTSGVARIELKITTGTHSFTYINGYLLTPFFNFQDLHNEIETNKKYASSAPTSTSANFKTGDMIFNSSPTAGGTVGWICIEGGNPGTWKSFGTISS